jgi:hypothetical protein
MKFYELAVGAVFTFRGVTYKKIGMSMAEDERRWENIFQAETHVEAEGPLLPPEEAAKWKPSELPWTHWMSRAPDRKPEG